MDIVVDVPLLLRLAIGIVPVVETAVHDTLILSKLIRRLPSILHAVLSTLMGWVALLNGDDIYSLVGSFWLRQSVHMPRFVHAFYYHLFAEAQCYRFLICLQLFTHSVFSLFSIGWFDRRRLRSLVFGVGSGFWTLFAASLLLSRLHIILVLLDDHAFLWRVLHLPDRSTMGQCQLTSPKLRRLALLFYSPRSKILMGSHEGVNRRIFIGVVLLLLQIGNSGFSETRPRCFDVSSFESRVRLVVAVWVKVRTAVLHDMGSG